MAGMFPEAGVTAPNTINADTSVNAATGCSKLFYAARCIPRFDPAAANAMLSEVLNVINLTRTYDCSRLDNLALAIQTLTNLCSLETYSAGPDTNDLFAGCFDGQQRLVTGQSVLDFVEANLGICALPTATNPDTNDLIGMCVDGVNSKVAVSDLIEILPAAELNICTLPTTTALTADDFVGVCVDGESFKTKIENLLALQVTVPGVTRFSGASSIPGERPFGEVAIADITYPRALRLSLALYDRTSTGTTSIDYHHFALAKDPFTGTGYSPSKVREPAIFGGGYQFYTYIPQYGALFRYVGGMIERNVLDFEPTETLYLGPWSDSTYDDFTTVVTAAHAGTIVTVANP